MNKIKERDAYMIWKDVVGYEGEYKVSEYGDILSVPRWINGNKCQYLTKEKMLTQHFNHKGYPVVSLSHTNSGKSWEYFIHRLVAEAFIPNPENKPQVNHIDGIKTNNHYSNLEWCTNGENQIHAYKMGLNKHSNNAGRQKRAVLKINPNTFEVVDEYKNAVEAAKLNNTTQGTLSSCCRQEYGRRTLKGYIWRYKDEYDKEKEKKDDYLYDKTVVQIKDGIIINTYGSPIEAERVTGINSGNIISCCNYAHNHKTAGGYVWRYKQKLKENHNENNS